jgi:hypothetical protein
VLVLALALGQGCLQDDGILACFQVFWVIKKQRNLKRKKKKKKTGSQNFGTLESACFYNANALTIPLVCM